MDLLTMEDYEKQSATSNNVLFFTTPLCGTCALARQMLELCLDALEKSLPTYECRVTDWQRYVQKWEITSVPCVVFERNGEALEKIYAIESVSKLYGLYKKYQDV